MPESLIDCAETAPPLLASKLTVAPLPAELVERSRLVKALDAGTTGPVTLVVAPAGWGKTTLLGSWYRSRAATATLAWLSVEAEDAGGRFWAYLRAALQIAGPVGADPGETSGHLDRLAAALACRAEPVVLVVDDLHRLADPAVAEGLDFLLRHAQDRLRLVVGARTEPSLALHRRRLGGELTEIRADELAFTPDETAELLSAHGVPQPADSARELVVRTEGWPAGLRYAALALREGAEPSGFIGGFSGEHPGIADYLAGEVLAGLADEVQEALRRTTIVEPVTGDLVNALTGREDGDRLLTGLERDTGFVIALGIRPPAYRCHRMLAELLRAELHRRHPDELVDLHRRAGAWCAEHQRPGDALRHTLAAGEWHRAIRVLVEHWPELVPIEPGAAAGLTGSPPALAAPAPPPRDVVRMDPELALAQAAERLAAHDLAAAVDQLRLADGYVRRDERLAGERRDRFLTILAALELTCAWLRGDLAAVPVCAARLRGLSRPAGRDVHAIAGAVSGAARLAAGDLSGAGAELTDACTWADQAGLGRVGAACAGRLALIHAVHGRLRAAEEAARGIPPSASPSSHAQLALALVGLHRDRPEEAVAHLALANRATDQVREPAVATLVDLIEAQLRLDRGDLAGAHQVIRAARQRPGAVADCPADHRLAQWLLAVEADLYGARGDTGAARELLLSGLRAADQDGSGGSEPVAVALARTHLRGGDARAAARILPDWDAASADAWFLPVRLDAGLIDAVTARLAGDQRRAARQLERVLELAEPEGFRRVFTHAPPPVRDLLAAHLDSGTAHWAMVHELVAASRRADEPQSPVSSPLVEPLTERELTILRYLQSILSNVEIAAELSLSVNTVKTHVRNIYRKLYATRRRDAVRRARELRLL